MELSSIKNKKFQEGTSKFEKIKKKTTLKNFFYISRNGTF